MACCPFHDDKHPSMKVDRRFHCFGCQTDGDVIDLCNGVSYGGGFRAAPLARMDDGLLDLVLVKKVSRLRIARVVGMYKAGCPSMISIPLYWQSFLKISPRSDLMWL